MKKFILVLIVCLGLAINSNAQKSPIKETKGSEFTVPKRDRVYNFSAAIKVDKDYYVIGRKIAYDYISILITYIPKRHNSDFIIYKLDSKMNYKAVSTIPAEYFDKNVESYTIKKFGENLCAIFYFNNRKQLRQYLFAQMLDIKTLKPIGKPYKIAENAITKKEKNISCIFKVEVTPDASKMLVTTDRSNIYKNRRQRKVEAAQKSHTFTYWLINSEFELINSSKNVKIGKGNTRIVGQTSDNFGNMCLLGYVSPAQTKGRNRKSDEEETDNESKLVMKIIKPTGEETDLEFAKGEYFYSASMKLNPSTGNVAVVGLVASGKGGAKGLFTQQVNLNTGEVLAESIQLFGVDLVKEILNLKPAAGAKSKVKKETKESKRQKSPKSRSSKNAGPVDYIYNLVRVGAIHYTDSNELIIVTQKYYTYTVTYTTTDSKGRTTTYTVTYHVYGDIISFKLNAEGEIENFGYVFHSMQTSGGDIFKDYSSLYSGDKLYLITTTEGGEIAMNNKASRTYPFKEYKTYRRKNVFADYITVSDAELLHVMATKRKLLFTLMSVKVDGKN